MAPYLYILIFNALGYLLENACVHSQIKGIILLDAFEMVNNHFVDGSLLYLRDDQDVIANAKDCLSIFFHASRDLVSDHKTNY